MRFPNEALSFLLLAILDFAVKGLVAASSRHCLFSLKPGTSLEFTASAGGRGLVLLQSFHASNVLECKTECCANARCNVVVFQRIRSELIGKATNCFTAHCNTALGCQSVRKTDYYLYSTSDAFILPPIATTSTIPTTTTVSITPKKFASTTSAPVSSNWLNFPHVDNSTNGPLLSNSTALPLSMTTAGRVLDTTATSVTAKSDSYNFQPSTFAVAVNVVQNAPTKQNVTSSYLTTDNGSMISTDIVFFVPNNASNGSTSLTDVSTLVSKKYRDGVQNAYGILTSIAVFGTLLLFATVYIMWKSHREVRYRQYKEIVFLMHDQDVLYA